MELGHQKNVDISWLKEQDGYQLINIQMNEKSFSETPVKSIIPVILKTIT